MPQGNPKPGEIYRHFKNKYYQVIAVATHSESREQLVIYQALYEPFGVFARPYDMFISDVDHEKYPDVTEKHRFTYQVLADSRKETSSGIHDSGSMQQTDSIQHSGSWQQTGNIQHSGSIQRADNSDDEYDGVSKNLLRFLDTDDMAEKYKILDEMRSDVTDIMIDNMAASLDVVIPDGDLDERFEHLRYAVRTRSRFENDRLRK
jgi:hypothetical protein